MGGSTFNMSEASEAPLSNGGRKGGFFISTAMGLVMLLLALCITVGVAVIVYFAVAKPDLQCAVTGLDGVGGTGSQVGGDGNGGVSVPGNSSGVWWPDTSCITECIRDGYCSDTGGAEKNDTVNPKPRDVRLPLWLKPIHYDVTLKPDIYTGNPDTFTNNGSVVVTMRCDQVTDRVTLQINKILNISGTTTLEVNSTGEKIDVLKTTRDLGREFVNFTLAKNLTVGEVYKLSLKYVGKLDNSLAGLYWSNYSEENAAGVVEQKYIATTQFQPTDARKAFPCFDEPAWKATFTIHLYKKGAGIVALSNMPEISANDEDDGWTKVSFDKTVKMSTYLLAFIVCDFDYQEGYTNNGTRFRVWSRKSAINQTKFALDEGIAQLTYFEEFFDELYPLPKQDMIAIPDFAAGAMENWGLITYRETALLYDDKVSAATNKQRVSVVVSHELAHQWFGNLVTPTWWDDLWLNEGFATYVEYLGVNYTQPEWDMMEQFVGSDIQGTFKADSLASSHPLFGEVKHPDEINEIFDSISYGKGGSLIRMMRFYLGDSVFQKGLWDYIDDRKYSDANHKQLWAAMQKRADQESITDRKGNKLNVQEIQDTWLLQMGYPVVTVEESTGASSGKQRLKITQKHFLQDDTQEPDPKFPSPYGYTWDIPLTIIDSSNPSFDVNYQDVQWFWRSEKDKLIEVDDNIEWFIINAKQWGFYRVNYPNSFWNKLVDQLKKNHEDIDPLNRAQIIDDSFNLALAGQLDIAFAMATTDYLANEKVYYPWRSTMSALSYVDMALKRSDAYGNFENYMKKLVAPAYASTNKNWAVDDNAPITDQYLQSLIISRACQYDVSDCLGKAKSLFSDWMRDNTTNPIDPNLRSAAYCYAVQEGGSDEWDFVYALMQDENVAVEKVKLLSALGCTKHIWLLQRLLKYSMDDTKIRKQDSYIAVGSVASNDVGRYLVWDWLRANWEQLKEKYGVGIGMLARFVSYSTQAFTTKYELQQIDDFVKMKGDLGTATRAFKQAKEKTEANIKYLEKNYDGLARWLSTMQ